MSNEEAGHRLRLAEGFLGEARHNLQHQLWRSCVSNSQLAAENAAKAVLGLLGPVGRTHDPGAVLLEALDMQRFAEDIEGVVRRIAECARILGPQVHIQSDYGDEATGRTPWEIFDEKKARDALQFAEEAVALAKQVVEGGWSP